MYRSWLYILFCGIFLFSCKKTERENHQIKKEVIVDLDDREIFNNQPPLKNKDSIVNFLNNYYQTVWENGGLSGGILVAYGDDILLEKYRGYGLPGNKMPITAETPMHVASVSKTMTALAVMKLVEAGQIHLTDPLTKYFPQFPYPAVTIKSLLSQRSGLPKYEYFIEKISPQPAILQKPYLTSKDILDLLIQYKPELSRDTETGFMYCNTNFALLSLVVENVTKKKFPDAMQSLIFRPLQMKHSFIFTIKDSAKVARSFYNRGNALFPYDRLDDIYGDKNVYTTPRDLLRFSKALYSDKFLKNDLKKMLFEPYSNEKTGINNYGLGFRMKIFDNGTKLTYHNGWWHGSNAVFAHLLSSKTTIIAIGNKYSQRVYSALTLSSLFENFGPEKEKLIEEMSPATLENEQADSTAVSSGE